MMRLSVQDSGSLGVLTLYGNLTRCHVEELKERLTQALDRVDRLIVNCEKVVSIDEFFIRQLCAAYRVSQSTKKEITLAGGIALFRRAVQPDGYAHCKEAGFECEERCPWREI